MKPIARLAWCAAWLSLPLSVIHALSRFATADGRADLDSAAVRWWAEPAARHLRFLLDWSSPDTVYRTYGKIWLPLMLAALAAAVVVRRHRSPHGLERVAWPIALAGFAGLTVSLLGDYFTPWMDESFAAIGIPAMLITMLGFLLLGIALLRRRFRPALAAWLLLLWVPELFLLSGLIALGAALIPVLFAWALAAGAVTAEPTGVPSVVGSAERSDLDV
jgi:hypothetical protein